MFLLVPLLFLSSSLSLPDTYLVARLPRDLTRDLTGIVAGSYSFTSPAVSRRSVGSLN